MKKIQIIFMFVVVVILAAVLFSVNRGTTGLVTNRTFVTYSDLFYDYEVTRYPSSVTIISPMESSVNPMIGFSIESWSLSFGMIPGNGSSAKRIVNLTNTRDKDVKITLRAYGEIAPLLNFSSSDLTLKPNEKTTVDIVFHTYEVPPGNYTGEVQVVVQIPKS